MLVGPIPLSSRLTNSNNFRAVHVFRKNKQYFQDWEVCSGVSCMPYRESQLDYYIYVLSSLSMNSSRSSTCLKLWSWGEKKFPSSNSLAKLCCTFPKQLKKCIWLYLHSCFIIIHIISYHIISDRKTHSDWSKSIIRRQSLFDFHFEECMKRFLPYVFQYLN